MTDDRSREQWRARDIGNDDGVPPADDDAGTSNGDAGDDWQAAPPVTIETGVRRRRRTEPAARSPLARTRFEAGAAPIRVSRPRQRRRWPIVLGGVLVLAALLVAAGAVLAVVRYVPAFDEAKALRADVAGIVKRISAAGVDMDRATLTAINGDLDRAQTRLDGLDAMLDGDPLVGIARGLPPTRDMVKGADGVVAAGNALMDAARAGMEIGDRFVAIREERTAGAAGSSTMAELVALLATSGEQADRALAAVGKARAAIATIPRNVPGPIAAARDEMVTRLDDYEPLLRAYTDVDAHLPSILGWDAPRRYLVLTQNPAELRPSGGIIGSFGIMTFDKGRLTERTFADVATLDVLKKYPFVTPPRELANYLLGDRQSWQLADANWSPDFPTAAQDALRLYTNESGDTRIDGVIAVTTYTVDRLLKATGPITIDGYDVTVASGETTLKLLQNTRVAAPGENRKAILPVFAEQLFGALFSLPAGKWATLVGDADAYRDQRLVQVWLRDGDDQAFLRGAGWAGEVSTAAGDFVYPVDSNVSPVSKLNMVTWRTQDLAIELDEVGNATSALELTWENRIREAEGAPLRQIKSGMGSLSDMGLVIRVMTPFRSRFEKASGGSYLRLDAPAFNRPDGDRQVFGHYLRIPPGRTTLRYEWTAPYVAEMVEDEDGAATGGEYRLTFQKQPGLLGGPIRVRVTVPDGMVISDASAGMVVDGRTASIEVPAFTRDLVLGVRFERAAQ